MLATLKKALKWNTAKSSEDQKTQSCLILAAFIGVLEDILFWRRMWLSLSFMFVLNVLFFLSVHWEVSLLEVIMGLGVIIMSIDAFEYWLKHKHRTSCLKQLASHGGDKIYCTAALINQWIQKRWKDFLFLRQTNHTKAFLIMNVNLVILLLVAKYVHGYVLTYFLLMFVCVFYKLILPVLKVFKTMKQDLESDCELEGLIPEVSEVDIKILSIESEQVATVEDKQIYDYWKPDDIPLAECSDSSENSSSIVTNFSMEKMYTLEKDVDTSDTSEDEYIPLDQQKEQVQTTLEVVEQANSWSSSAYNAFWNITGAVANMMHKESAESKRKRLSSRDSSDGFEMIYKNDLI